MVIMTNTSISNVSSSHLFDGVRVLLELEGDPINDLLDDDLTLGSSEAPHGGVGDHVGAEGTTPGVEVVEGVASVKPT